MGNFQPSQPSAPPDEGKKQSFWRWVIAAVVVPLLAAAITAYITHPRPGPQPTNTPVTFNSPVTSYPQLHPRYTGRAVNTGSGVSFLLALDQVSENSQTGSWTATFVQEYACNGSACNCTGLADGTVGQEGSVSFTYTPSPSAPAVCQVGEVSHSGSIQAGGGITGTWYDAATNSSGTFTLT